jgi:hypothetical protein
MPEVCRVPVHHNKPYFNQWLNGTYNPETNAFGKDQEQIPLPGPTLRELQFLKEEKMTPAILDRIQAMRKQREQLKKSNKKVRTILSSAPAICRIKILLF